MCEDIDCYIIDYSLGYGRDDKSLLEEPFYVGKQKDFDNLLEK